MAIDIHRERTRGEKINWIVYIVKTRDWHVLVGFAESADFDSSPADWQPDKALENNCLFDVTIAWYVNVKSLLTSGLSEWTVLWLTVTCV